MNMISLERQRHDADAVTIDAKDVFIQLSSYWKSIYYIKFIKA